MVLVDRQPASSRRSRRDSKGLRYVLQAMAGREIPVTAQALFIELREHGHDLGLVTVYRALHVLRDDGRLHEFHGADGIAFRACTTPQHHHLICVTCGRVQEQQPTAITEWLNTIESDGFAVQTCTVEVHGICDRCHSQPRPP